MITAYRCAKCGAKLLGVDVDAGGTPVGLETVRGVTLSFDEDDNATLTCVECGAETPAPLVKQIVLQLRQRPPER